MVNVLVTGNMGYIGPLLVERLKRDIDDCRVVGYDAGYFAHILTNAEVLPETFVDQQHFGDLRDMSESLLDGIDAVIHLGAISNDPIGNAFEGVTDEINFAASARIAQMAKKKGCRCFVFASSCSVYGAAGNDARKENDPLDPLTAYARSKVFMEQELVKLADDNFIITNLRFSTACGMSPRIRLDLVLNDFVASALTTGRIEILSDGTPWRPLIDVKDMVTAMIWALSRKLDQGISLSVNVGRNDWNYQIKNVATAVAEVLGNIDVQIAPNAMPDKRSYRVDFSLYKSLAPNHQPEVDLTQSIMEIRDGLIGMGFSDGEFRDSHFMRLNVLQRHIHENRLSNDLRWI